MRKDFKNLKRRYARTLYYGRLTNRMDRLSMPLTDFVVEYFDAFAPFDYLDPEFAVRLSLEGSVGPTTLIVAMIYLERLRLMDKNQFESSDPADLFSSALLCASKYLYDNDDEDFVYNDEWSASCSKSLAHVNEKEIEFLTGIAWNLLAKEEEFQRYLTSIEKHVALKEGSKRNCFVYSDLSCLLNWNELKDFIIVEILGPLLSVIGLAIVTYVVSLFGMYALSLHMTNVKLQTLAMCKNPSDLKLGIVCAPVEPPAGFYMRNTKFTETDSEESDLTDSCSPIEVAAVTGHPSLTAVKKPNPNPNVVGIYRKSPLLMEDAIPHLTKPTVQDICDLSSASARNMTNKLLSGIFNLDISMRILL